jgi:hypothetical protein
MMRKQALLLSVFLLVFAAPGSAAELWKTKPVKEWSQEETQHFMRNSPWVKQVSVGSLVDMEPPLGTSQTRAGRGESSGAQEAPSTETIDVERGERGAVFFIEWGSARIVRQVDLHYRVLLGQAKEEEEPPSLPVYVLTVNGANLQAFATATEAEVKAGVSLRLKQSHTQIEAVDAKIRKGKDDRVVAVQFAFPREVNGQPTIPDQEKSVEFSCKVKGLTLRTEFNLTKMSTAQGRDL